MTKAEAAVALTISVRSLERLVKSGQLTQGRSLINGRRVATFDSQEVAVLSERLFADRPQQAPSSAREVSETMPTISFRIPQMHLDALVRQGAERGLSASTMARLHVIDAIERPQGSEAFTQEVHQLRDALAETFFNFLTLKCDTSPEAAKKFVREHFLRS